MTDREKELESHLGKDSNYIANYDFSLLRSITRSKQRSLIGIPEPLPFMGEDRWRCYELTWLDSNGKPEVAIVSIRVPCTSLSIVESKSLKLYLNSFSQTEFNTRQGVQETIRSDLTKLLQSDVFVGFEEFDALTSISEWPDSELLDLADGFTVEEHPDPSILKLKEKNVVREKTVFTNLFRSVCPETGQPDMASIYVRYSGPTILPESLLSFLLSFRNHAAFHETVVEQIFIALKEMCCVKELTVYGCFLRRGGIDINPFRSTHEHAAPFFRVPRQ